MAEPTGPFINLEYVFYKIYTAIYGVPQTGTTGEEGTTLSTVDGGLFGKLQTIDLSLLFSIINGVLGFVVLLLIVGIIYVYTRIRELKKEMEKQPTFAESEHVGKEEKNEQWEVILKHLASDNSSDWRMAIIEADNIMDDMVKRMGYEGKDMGERLRAVEPSDFTSIQSAWEAHKVRNKIAHDGLGFEISQREAKRVIGLYEQVFREFEYI